MQLTETLLTYRKNPSTCRKIVPPVEISIIVHKIAQLAKKSLLTCRKLGNLHKTVLFYRKSTNLRIFMAMICQTVDLKIKFIPLCMKIEIKRIIFKVYEMRQCFSRFLEIVKCDTILLSNSKIKYTVGN